MEIGALTPANSAATQSQATLAEDFDTFLQLLTTQLQNQDPLEPMDSNEFTDQLVQFTGVEQAIATNQNLEALISLVNASTTGAALGYLGQDAVAATSTTALQNGSAVWTYDLDGRAEEVALTITDQSGRVVFTGEGPGESGRNTFTWDGQSNGGSTLPDGSYTLQVSAQDSSGNRINTETFVIGRVSAVDFDPSGPLLTINGQTMPLSLIQSVSEPNAES